MLLHFLGASARLSLIYWTFYECIKVASYNTFNDEIKNSNSQVYINTFIDSKNLVDIVSKEKYRKVCKKIALHHNSLYENNININFFTDEILKSVGSDIENYIPEDYKNNIDHLKYKGPEKFKLMLEHVNKKWLELSKISNIPKGFHSSLINTKIPFFVPGDRFREFYYWDSYWILKGLLKNKMTISAKNLIENMLFMIKKYGFIPNGSRKYYIKRSQPPMFCQMIYYYLNFDFENNKDFVLKRCLKPAIKEYEWFMKNRVVKFKFNNKNIILNQYKVKSNKPRFESYKEDFLEFQRFREINKGIKNNFYSNVYSGAESGWDFSTRFMEDNENLYSLNLLEIIPVDLNAIMYKNEKIIYKLLILKNKFHLAKKFKKKALRRKEFINLVLWNKNKNIWNDYNFVRKSHVDKTFYFSNIMPMLYGINNYNKKSKNVKHSKYVDNKAINLILKNNFDILFGFKGGVPASMHMKSNQQWDFPNVWAPHQSMLVDFLLKSKHRILAAHVAQSFVENVYTGFIKENVFREKYTCNRLGEAGNAGEYAPQTGFGWTNGVLIDFLIKFQDEFVNDYDFKESLKKVRNYVSELEI